MHIPQTYIPPYLREKTNKVFVKNAIYCKEKHHDKNRKWRMTSNGHQWPSPYKKNMTTCKETVNLSYSIQLSFWARQDSWGDMLFTAIGNRYTTFFLWKKQQGIWQHMLFVGERKNNMIIIGMGNHPLATPPDLRKQTWL